MTTIETRLGKITGQKVGSVLGFLGIRYGQSPAGEQRFKPSIAETAWGDQTYDATEFRHSAMQPPPMDFFSDNTVRINTSPSYDEDCLFLNVYTPAADGKPRPVLYWIHGGSYVSGSGYEYDGRVLAEQGDAVIVTINYRLGLLGFMDLSDYGEEYRGSASNGIGDQILGLEWVRDNIADFGGDPANVTIFGESAGAGSVNGILAAPRADGLYHRAIAHSGNAAATPPPSLISALAGHLKIESEALLEKLLSMSGQEIIDMQIASGIGPALSVDGHVITRPTWEAIADRGPGGVPYIAGSNANEGTLFTLVMPGNDELYENFAPYMARLTMDGADPDDYLAGLKALYPNLTAKELYEAVWNDLFRRASINLCEAASKAGPGGWLYRFDLPTNIADGKQGATHASEIAFTFNTFADSQAGGVVMHDRDDAAVRELASRWSQTVLNFAKTGDPNGGGLPAWPVYEADNRQSLVMDRESRIEGADLDEAHRKLWSLK